MRKRRFKLKGATRIITKLSKQNLHRQRKIAKLSEQEANQQPEVIVMEYVDVNAVVAVIYSQLNVHHQQPQFERRERQIVSNFTW